MEYAVITEKGNREVNEDSYRIENKDNATCFVLCDGLGGHGKGDVASKIVTDTFAECFKNEDKNFFDSAFKKSQEMLEKKQDELGDHSGMKTTAVAAIVDCEKVSFANVGDSRLYVFNRNKNRFRTTDHSVPQMLVFTKEIKEKEIRHHPDRNKLLSVLGNDTVPNYDIYNPFPLKKCQALLLCSDGFWELITEKEMSKALKNYKTADAWLNEMKRIAEVNGSDIKMDNYTAIAVII